MNIEERIQKIISFLGTISSPEQQVALLENFLSANFGYNPPSESSSSSSSSSAVPLPTIVKLGGTIIGTPGSFANTGNTIDKAFDGKLDTVYDGATSGNNWLGVDFGSKKLITEIRWAPREKWLGRVVGGKFQGSNTPDFKTATDLYVIATTPVDAKLNQQSVYSPYGFRYVRYLAPPNSFGNIAEIEFYGSDGGADEPAPASSSSATPASSPTPTPIPAPKPIRMNGAISDAGTVAAVSAFYKELGFNSNRIWVGLTDKGDCDEGKLKTVNSYFAQDISPRIVLTPQQGSGKVPQFPELAIAKIINTLDKRVQVNLINEPNWGNYWASNDWMGAFKWASAVAEKLRAAGFKVGSPSFTGWEDSWEGYWDQIIKNGYHVNFDVLVFHNYPNISPTTKPDAFVARFDKTNATVRRIADKLSSLLGRTITVDCDEWGLGKSHSDEVFAKLMPALQSSLNKYTNASAYFIISRSGTAAAPKDPHDYFNWAIDFKTGERRKLVVDAFKAASALTV